MSTIEKSLFEMAKHNVKSTVGKKENGSIVFVE